MPESMTTNEVQHPINTKTKVPGGTRTKYICITMLTTVMFHLPLYGEAKKDVIETAGKKIIDGKEYELVWADEFNGAKLDETKWRPRILGYGYAGQYSTAFDSPYKGAFLDGQGNLVLAMCALSKSEVLKAVTTEEEKIATSKLADDVWIPSTSHIVTKDPFLYGYFELRFKLPLVPGPGLTFWFPGSDGTSTEIDVIEQTLYNGGFLVDYKSSTIHWYTGGYKEENHRFLSHQRERENIDKPAEDIGKKIIINLSTNVDLSTNGLIRIAERVKENHFFWDDGKFHTVALLWTPEKLSFYYDDELVCSYHEGVPHVPECAILWLRNMDSLQVLSGKKGRKNPQETPARVLIDYLRVYNTTSKRSLDQ